MLYISSFDNVNDAYRITDSLTNESVIYTAEQVKRVTKLGIADIHGTNVFGEPRRDYTEGLKNENLAVRDKILGVVLNYKFDIDCLIYPIFEEEQEYIRIPDWAEVLHLRTFDSQHSVKKLVLGKQIRQFLHQGVGHFQGLKEVVLNDGLVEICEMAFHCSALEEVYIPESVTKIGEDAFRNSDKLQKVVLPDNLRTVPRGCFFNCINLRFVNIPKNCTLIYRFAFQGCHMESIALPETLERIMSFAFSDCTYIKSVVIPESCKKIDYGAFSNCVSIESIVLPNTDIAIEPKAFENCPYIKSIVIPDLLTVEDVTKFLGRPVEDGVIQRRGSHAVRILC